MQNIKDVLEYIYKLFEQLKIYFINVIYVLLVIFFYLFLTYYYNQHTNINFI